MDRYGGNAENWAGFVVEIIKKARELGRTDYPLMIKMNCDDLIP